MNNENNELTFKVVSDGILIPPPQPPPPVEHNLTFWTEEKQIGKLWVNKDSKLEFEGDAEESAKVFIKWLKELWAKEIKC